MSKNKKQGTTHETWIVNRLQDAGLFAARLAERGSKDEGDVEVLLESDERWVLEAKCAERLSVHTVLSKATAKAGGAPTAVVWKRLLASSPDAKRRTSQGVTVTLWWDDFVRLLHGSSEAGRTMEAPTNNEVPNG